MSSELLAVDKSAVLSEDGVYRYELTRKWATGHFVTWVMLNPSKADAEVDDLTITKCCGFAQRWGYAGIVVVNLFALRSTDPKAIGRHADPRGPQNYQYLHAALLQNPLTVAAWGSHPDARLEGRRLGQHARRMGRALHCLGTTLGGSPRHPSRIAYSTELALFGPDGDREAAGQVHRLTPAALRTGLSPESSPHGPES